MLEEVGSIVVLPLWSVQADCEVERREGGCGEERQVGRGEEGVSQGERGLRRRVRAKGDGDN